MQTHGIFILLKVANYDQLSEKFAAIPHDKMFHTDRAPGPLETTKCIGVGRGGGGGGGGPGPPII